MRRQMLCNSKPGDAVYDPFLGSGTSLVAAETCQRVCLGMELDPAYVDVAVMRWQRLTGEQAVHAKTGLPFDDLVETLEPESTVGSVKVGDLSAPQSV